MPGFVRALNVALLLTCILGEVSPNARTSVLDIQAEEILARARAAVGGEAALRSVRSLILERAREQIRILLPDRYQAVLETSSGRSVKTLDGDTVWTISPHWPASIQAAAAAASEKEDIATRRRGFRAQLAKYALIYLLRLPDGKKTAVRTLGEVSLGGLKGIGIEISAAGVSPVRLLVDPGTYQPLALVRELKTSANGPRLGDAVTLLEDYREVQGLRVPFRLVERHVNQPKERDRTMGTFQYTAVRINSGLDAGDFARSAFVK